MCSMKKSRFSFGICVIASMRLTEFCCFVFRGYMNWFMCIWSYIRMNVSTSAFMANGFTRGSVNRTWHRNRQMAGARTWIIHLNTKWLTVWRKLHQPSLALVEWILKATPSFPSIVFLFLLVCFFFRGVIFFCALEYQYSAELYSLVRNTHVSLSWIMR